MQDLFSETISYVLLEIEQGFEDCFLFFACVHYILKTREMQQKLEKKRLLKNAS
jgi:hypothetical protein